MLGRPPARGGFGWDINIRTISSNMGNMGNMGDLEDIFEFFFEGMGVQTLAARVTTTALTCSWGADFP